MSELEWDAAVLRYGRDSPERRAIDFAFDHAKETARPIFVVRSGQFRVV
jgi:hypothetical protein